MFGSFARRDAREDSDVDVLVLGDGTAEPRLGRLSLDPVTALAYHDETLPHAWCH